MSQSAAKQTFGGVTASSSAWNDLLDGNVTEINGGPYLNTDIATFLDAAPKSGPIIIPPVLVNGFSSPGSTTRFEQVYSGDIDASTSSRAFAQIEGGEICVVGARRIDHDDGENYGFGALGIEYRSDKTNGGAQIPDIDGIIIRELRIAAFGALDFSAAVTGSVSAKAYTLFVWGSGSVAITGTGSGTASAGSPVQFTPTAGSLTLTPTGTVDAVTLFVGTIETENEAPIVTTFGAELTRLAQSAELAGIPAHTSGQIAVGLDGEWMVTEEREFGDVSYDYDLSGPRLQQVVILDKASNALKASATKWAIWQTTDTTIYIRRTDVTPGTEILFRGSNGAEYSSSNLNTTHDVGAQGLEAPITIIIPNTGMDSLTYWNSQSNHNSGPLPDISGMDSLTTWSSSNNKHSGPLPDISGNTSMTNWNSSNNQHSGPLPDISGMDSLTYWYSSNNQHSGPLPDISGMYSLIYWYSQNNQHTGPLPDVSGNTSLARWYSSNNQHTGLEAGFGVTDLLGVYEVQSNLLTESDVDGILAAFVAAGRTSSDGTVILNIGGTGNAAPSASGVTDKTTLEGRGWTVTTN